MVQDSVCIDMPDNTSESSGDHCLRGFDFFGITEQTGLTQADGILGLSPNVRNNGPSFVERMHLDGLIDAMQVSFFLSLQRQSQITFGSYDQSRLKEGAEVDGYGMHWYDLTGTQHWQVEIQDLMVEGESVFSHETTKAILDSGTSFITVPSSDFKKIQRAYQSRFSVIFNCQTTGGAPFCFFVENCEKTYTKLDHLQVQLGDDWQFSVPP